MFLYFSEFAFVGGVSEIVVERIVIVVRILAGSKNVFFSGNFLNGFKSTKCRVLYFCYGSKFKILSVYVSVLVFRKREKDNFRLTQ